MRPLSPEEYEELRLIFTGSAAPCDRTDELIRFLDAVAISFIDQAFGFSAVQMSLSTRANRAFSASDSCDPSQLSGKKRKDKLKVSGVESPNIPHKDCAP